VNLQKFRNLTNLETGSFEFLDSFGKPEMKEADTESLTESEELSIIGEDLVIKQNHDTQNNYTQQKSACSIQRWLDTKRDDSQ